MSQPDAISEIKRFMTRTGKTRADLAKLLGQSRASELLHRRRDLYIGQVKRLVEEWGMDANLLVHGSRGITRKEASHG